MTAILIWFSQLHSISWGSICVSTSSHSHGFLQNNDTSWMCSTLPPPPFFCSSYSAWVQIMAWLIGNFLHLMIHPYFEHSIASTNTLHFGFILPHFNFVFNFNNTYCRTWSPTNIQFHHIFLCSRCVSVCEVCTKRVCLMNYFFPAAAAAATTTTTTTTTIITIISSCFSPLYKV